MEILKRYGNVSFLIHELIECVVVRKNISMTVFSTNYNVDYGDSYILELLALNLTNI